MHTPEARSKSQAASVEDWATESLPAARQAYQDPATGQRMKPGAKLAGSYQVANLRVARSHLYDEAWGWRWFSMRRSSPRRSSEGQFAAGIRACIGRLSADGTQTG